MNFIPKIVHMSWVKKYIANHPSDFIQNGLGNLIRLNPEWKVTIYEDHEIEEYIKSKLGINEYKLFENTSIVEKSDIWRLLKIYFEGGLYSDLDRLHNIPLNNIIEKNTKCVLPTCLDLDFSHTFMMSAPQNPIFSTTIDLLLQRRFQGYRHVYFLGPQTYMHGVTKTLFGEIIDSNPGKEKFDEIRKALSQVSSIKTYRETGPGDLITNKLNITEEEYEKQKRAFYAEFGIKHWTGEW